MPPPTHGAPSSATSSKRAPPPPPNHYPTRPALGRCTRPCSAQPHNNAAASRSRHPTRQHAFLTDFAAEKSVAGVKRLAPHMVAIATVAGGSTGELWGPQDAFRADLVQHPVQRQCW